jgi:hypothetical protein
MVMLINNPEEYLRAVNLPVFKDNQNQRTIDDIAKDIRNVIFSRVFPLIEQIYFVNSPVFEPDRNSSLITYFNEKLVNPIENMTFISPTYKTTITEDEYIKNVKKDLMLASPRQYALTKSELSLFLNYKAILENIVMNYNHGMFLICHSDIMPLQNILDLNPFLEMLNKQQNDWDVIDIGLKSVADNEDMFKSPFCKAPTPYRNNELPDVEFIEDITNSESKVRLIRKYYTRFTDSMLWTYEGVRKFVHYLNKTDTNYGSKIEDYITNFLEINRDLLYFKHYWASTQFFIQGSKCGVVKSTM